MANFKRGGLTASQRRLYDIWHSMLRRCLDANCKDFPLYGGRGIMVCCSWGDFEKFVSWAMDSGYESHLTLDRIDSNGNYEPDNCRWIDMAAQARNRSSCIRLSVNGLTMVAKDWAEFLDVSCFTLYSWVRRHGEAYACKRIADKLAAKKCA